MTHTAGFNAGIEAAAQWHGEQADKYLARMDGACSGHERSFIAQRHSFHRWAAEELNALKRPETSEAEGWTPEHDDQWENAEMTWGDAHSHWHRRIRRGGARR